MAILLFAPLGMPYIRMNVCRASLSSERQTLKKYACQQQRVRITLLELLVTHFSRS